MLEFDQNCTILIYNTADGNSGEGWMALKSKLESTYIPTKIKAMEDILISMMYGETHSKLLMSVIMNVIPSNNHRLIKLSEIFIEIVDKCQPDGTLREEMILLCNALRNNLKSHNEYVRGSSLRLICKIRYLKILEPLIDCIVENLQHRIDYVRKNAVMCVFSIVKTFGVKTIPNCIEIIYNLIEKERDLTVRRNAFLMLQHTDLNRSLQYVASIQNRLTQNGDDIFKLSLFEFICKACRADSSKKDVLLRVIKQLIDTSSPSVAFEGASSLLLLSQTPMVLKLANEAYVKLLVSQSDNNVKLIILDKINEIIRRNKQIVEDSVVDILWALKSHSFEVKRKTMDIMLKLVCKETAVDVISILKKEITTTAETQNANLPEIKDYRRLLIRSVHALCSQFPSSITHIIDLLMDLLIESDNRVTTEVSILIREIVSTHTHLRESIFMKIASAFTDIQQSRALRVCLWIVGEFCDSIEILTNLTDILFDSIVPLKPITENSDVLMGSNRNLLSETDTSMNLHIKTKISTRTIILEDGTYGTEDILVNDDGTDNTHTHKNEDSINYHIKNLIQSGDFLLCAILAINLTKIAYKHLTDDTPISNTLFNKISLILANLLKFVKVHPFGGVKNDSYIRINQAFKGLLVLNNDKLNGTEQHKLYKKILFTNGDVSLEKVLEIELTENQMMSTLDDGTHTKATHIEANQPIQFFQSGPTDNDDEIFDNDGDVLAAAGAEKLNPRENDARKFQQRLSKVQPMTGLSDPVYIEAFVEILQFDLLLELNVTNRTSETLQNLTIELFTQGDMKLVEKPNPITLSSFDTHTLYASIRVQSMDSGMIFGYVWFDKRGAGVTESIVLNEIQIDILDFIKRSWINELSFRSKWAEYEWENKLDINTHFTDAEAFSKHIMKHTNMTLVCKYYHRNSDNNTSDNNYTQGDSFGEYMKFLQEIKLLKNLSENTSFFAANLYCRSIFGEDALTNISIEKLNNKLAGSVRIRSRTQGVALNIGDRITLLQQMPVL